MSDIAIRVEGLGKRYKRGVPERLRTLGDTLADTFTAPFRWFQRGRSASAKEQTFWALEDISFDAQSGCSRGYPQHCNVGNDFPVS